MTTLRNFIQRKSRSVVAALGSMLTFRNVVLPLLFGAILVFTHAQQVHAGPKDGNVVAGDANIVQLNPKLLEIIQSSDKVIIDWRSFSIDWDELVRFLQPDSDSIALNRVNGDTPSYILGQLTADGRVMLINPNGVLFGDSAVVDIGSLVATTIDIRNEDFMAGDYNFDVDRASGGTVVNRGRITAAEGGIVALVAPGVENSGVIVARLGRVALASGNSFALDFYGDRLIQIGVDDSVAERLLAPDGTELKALVDNSGEIYADGGTVMLMAASVAKDVVDYAINMEGIIEARTATERNGQIVLEGAGEGIVRVTGTLDASGRESGDAGGNVKILGSKVGIVGQAEVDVSGDAGGGEVLIGGNFQGRGPERNAEFTTIGREVAIQADALTTGDGGRVIVWSDRVTRFYGNISARGGSVSGDGGFAEISGKQHLQFAPNSIDLSAPKGLIGELLLDPLDIVISDGDGSDDSAVSMDNVIYFNDDSTATYNITPAAFEAIDADITLQALQDITVSSPIDRTGSGDSTLTLQAGRNLTIDANITGSNGAHSFIFEADSPRSSNNDGVGTLTIASGVTITSSNRTSNTGDITFGHITLIGAEFDINATSSINAGGDIYVAPSRAVAMMISTAASDLSNTNLSNAEIGRFITSGTIYIGTATTGPDGSGGAGSSISASGITVSQDLTISGSASLVLRTGGDITVSNSIVKSGSADSTLALQAGGDLTINANITGSSGAHSLIFEADSPGLSSNDGNGTLKIESGVIITSNNGDITLIGAEFDIDSTSSINAGTGDIHVAPSRSVAMTISTTADLSLAEIGRFTTSGTIHIGTATTGPSGSGGAGSSISANGITVSEALTISGSASLVLDSGGMTTLSADVSTYDGDITFEDAVTLGANVTVKSDADGDATDGNITFASTVEGGQMLTLDADSGAVEFRGAVGGTSATSKLVSLTVDGYLIRLKSVRTTGEIKVTMPSIGFGIYLNGDYLSDDGDITFVGDLRLDGAVRVDSDANDDATDGNISLTFQVIGNGHALTVDASDGMVTLRTTVGTTTKLGSLTVTGGQIHIGSVRTINNIDITGTNIDLDLLAEFKSEDGNITFTGPVDLLADVTVDSDADDDGTAGNITFTSTVVSASGGNRTLTLDAGGGTVALQGVVGGTTATTALRSLAVTGGLITLSANVSTDDGAITFTGPVELAGDVTVDSDADDDATDGNITFTSTVVSASGGNRTLTLDAGGGTVALQGVVGGTTATTALRSLAVTGGLITLSANVSTDDGAITFTGPVELAGDVTVDSDADDDATDGNITFTSTVVSASGGNRTLTLDAGGGTVALQGVVGGTTATTALRSLAVTGGLITLSANVSTDDGAITFTGPVELAGDVTVDSDADDDATDGNITFTSTVVSASGGNRTLTLDAGGGTVALQGVVGGTTATTALRSLAVTGGLITLSANVSTDDGAITFTGPVELAGDVTVDSDADDDATDGNITFTSTVVSASGGNRTLTLDAGGGTVALQGVVGGTTATTALRSLAVTGGLITLSANVSTDDGAITFTGPVELAGDVTVDSDADDDATDGNITFTSTVVSASGGNRTLTLDAGGGTVALQGVVGGTTATTALRSLAVTGGLITLSANVSTDDGAITFTGPVELAGDVTVDSDADDDATDGNITFTSTVVSASGGNRTLTLDAGGGTVALQGVVGGTTATTALRSLAVTGGLITLSANVSTDDGAITFTGPVELAGDVTVDSDADDDATDGNITFTSTVVSASGGNRTLTLDAGGGTVALQGVVGGTTATTALRSLAVTGGLITLSANVSTDDGAITFTGPVELAGDVTVDSDADDDATDGNITFTSTVVSASGGNRTLTLDAGGGTVALQGVVGGTTATTALRSLAVTGGLITLSANVSTDDGAITFTGPVELAGDVTVDSDADDDATDGNITFTSTVVSASGGNRTLTLDAGGGTVALQGVVGGTTATTALRSLAVTGGLITLSANVSTDDGAITFTGPVELAGDVTVDSDADDDATDGNITFTSTVVSASGGNRTLTLDAGGGTVALQGVVGGTTATTALRSLAVTGGLITLSANVSTDDGAITFTGPVELAGDVTVDSDADDDATDGNITFTSTVVSASGGNRTLTLDAGGGTVALQGVVGGTTATTALRSLAVTGGLITLSANVSTDDGAITFTGPVELAGDVTVDSDADDDGTAGDITFTSTVVSASGGNRTLTLDAGGGTVALQGVVGGTTATTALRSLAVTGGLITLSANVSTDDGAITFTGPVELAGDVTVDSDADDDATDGNITFTSTVVSASGGNRTLTLDAGGGTVALQGVVGGTTATTALRSLAVTGGLITLSANVSTDDGAITFTGPVELAGDVTVDSDADDDATDGNITFTSTVVSASGGNRTLTLDAGGGTVALQGVVGGTTATTALRSLAVTGGLITLSANVSTDDGAITFTGPVELAGDVTVDSDADDDATDGNITFTSTVVSASGGNRTLTLDAGGGTVALQGVVGGTTATTALRSLAVTGGLITLSANVSTDDGAITFTGPVELAGDVTVDSDADDDATDGNITFTSTVVSASGGNRTLTLDAGGGTVEFRGAVGGTTATTALRSLAVTGGLITLSANVSTDDGAITFTGPVELAGDVTVDSDADDDATDGNITFTSTVVSASGGNRTLTLDAGGGTVALQGVVGGTTATTALRSLAVTGGLITLSANVSTDDGAITFTGPVELAGDVTVDSDADDDATDGNITFTSTVVSASGGNRTLTLDAGGGTVALQGVVGGTTATTALRSLAVTGGLITLSANVSTDDGAITFTGPVELAGDVTVDSDADDDATDGNITFTSTVVSASGGNRTLTLDAGGGTVALQGVVGGTTATTALRSLAVTGGLITLSANVSTDDGAITFTGPVELAGDVTVDSDADDDATDGNITFTSTVVSASGGNRTLTLDAGGGTVEFRGAVGGTSATTKLVSLTVTGGEIDLDTVATIGNIDIEGSMGIALNGATYASDNGDITLGGAGGVTISGDASLVLRAGGNITVNTSIERIGSADSTLALQAGGNLTINADIIGRNGAHSFIFEADSPGLSSNDGNGTLKIASGVTITSNNGDITLIGAEFEIDTSSSINAGTGDIHVAPSRAVAMTISNAVTGNLSDAEIGRFTTSGTVYIGTAITGPSGSGGAGSSISATSITVSQDLTISGSASLVLDSSGVTTLSAKVSTDDGNITFEDAVTLGADVSTDDGDITFTGPVTLAANVTVDSDANDDGTGGDITFFSMLDGAYNLILNSGTGNIYFRGDVGSADKLSAITVDNAHDVTVATTMWVGSFTQTAGTGTTDFGLNTVNADTSVNVTTVNIRGKIVTQDARLTAQEDIISTVEVDSLMIEASNAYLFGTIDGVGGRAASDLIDIKNRVSGGTYTINDSIVLGTGLGTRTYVELSSLPLATITPAAGVFAWLTPMLRASVNDSISGPYIVTDSEASSPLLTSEHGAEDYYEDIPLLLKTHDDEMVEME